MTLVEVLGSLVLLTALTLSVSQLISLASDAMTATVTVGPDHRELNNVVARIHDDIQTFDRDRLGQRTRDGFDHDRVQTQGSSLQIETSRSGRRPVSVTYRHDPSTARLLISHDGRGVDHVPDITVWQCAIDRAAHLVTVSIGTDRALVVREIALP